MKNLVYALLCWTVASLVFGLLWSFIVPRLKKRDLEDQSGASRGQGIS